MAELGWLTRALADVPRHDGWLSEREREILSTLRIPQASRRLAARALGGEGGAGSVAGRAGCGGRGPAGGRTEHLRRSRAARGYRWASPSVTAPGGRWSWSGVCRERSDATWKRSSLAARRSCGEWLRPAERELLNGLDGEPRDLAANLLWTAKEAASKARREGLRLNLRQATVEPGRLAHRPGSWERLRVAWEDGPVELGWWRREPEWVMAVVSDPAVRRAAL